MGSPSSSNQMPRIAFMGAGVGFPAEKSTGQGIPTLIALLGKLAPSFEIIIYSLIRIQKNQVPEGVRVRQVTAFPLPTRVKYLLLLGQLILDNIRKNIKILVAVSAFPAGRMAVPAGKMLGITTVIQLIGSEAVKMADIGYGDLLHPALAKIVRRVCMNAGGVIAMSNYHRKIIQQNLQLDQPITVLPLRIDVKKFPAYQQTVSSPVQFLHIGAYQPVKDQDTLFRAFAIIIKSAAAHLIVIGDGFRNPQVDNLLTTLEIKSHVTLVGVVKNSELTHYFSKAHIFLNTSQFDSGCSVVQEAMASGVPVCATEVGILADLDSTFALTVRPGDSNELAAKALGLINDPESYESIQRNAYQFMMGHELVWAAKQYKEYFEAIMSSP